MKKATKKKKTTKLGRKSQYTFAELNKLAQRDDVAVLIDSTYGRFTLDYFMELEEGEDYYDPEDEAYQWADGSPCALVAYVTEMHEHIPWNCIENILVGWPVKVK